MLLLLLNLTVLVFHTYIKRGGFQISLVQLILRIINVYNQPEGEILMLLLVSHVDYIYRVLLGFTSVFLGWLLGSSWTEGKGTTFLYVVAGVVIGIEYS